MEENLSGVVFSVFIKKALTNNVYQGFFSEYYC